MRISANLIPRRIWMVSVYGWTLFLACLALICSAIMLMIDIYNIRMDDPNLEQQLRSIKKQLQPLVMDEQKPSDTKLRDMRDRIKSLNEIGISHGVGAVTILNWLESNLPDTVYLISLHYRIDDGEIVLVAESLNEKDFTLFLRRIEQQSWFSDAVYKSTATGNQESGSQQYELQVSLK